MSHLESDVNYIFKCNKQLNYLAEKLVTLSQGKKFCDTTLIAGADNKEVKTHRLVLYLSSEYFRTMFDSVSENHAPEVISINNIDGDTLNKVIGFMYTFEIEMSKASIEKVLNAATLFQMETLIKGCCDLMTEMQKKPKIILAYCFIGRSLPVFTVDSYDPDLNKWSVEDWPQPSQMRKDYGIVTTANECYIAGGKIGDFCTKSVECLDLKTMNWSCLPSMIKERSYLGMAVLNGNLYVVGGYDKTGWIRMVEKYDFTDGKWTTLAELPIALQWVKVVSIGGKLYVSCRGISHLMCYDPAINEWSDTPEKNEKSSDFGLTANEEYVYAVGGRMNDKDTNAVERYNPADNTWTVMESMTRTRSGCTCLTVGDKLLVCGGKSYLHKRIPEEYNERTKEWKDLDQCSEKFKNFYYFSDHLSIIYQ